MDLLTNSVATPKDNGKDDRTITSNDIEKALELQNSVMLRRRFSSTFGYPDFGYRPGLNLYSDNPEPIQNPESIYEQQKLLQNLLKHYQTKVMEESSQWLNAGGLLYQKRPENEDTKEEEGRLKEEVRKRYKREEDGKVFTKQRKTNFTAKEVETLLNCVADRKEVILFGVAGGKGWAKAWQDIAKDVTKAEGIDRTEGDVRKKWTYLKWEAKNTSKPGRDPVSKHVLNILTARDREVDAAMNLRTSVDTFPQEGHDSVLPGDGQSLQSRASPDSTPPPPISSPTAVKKPQQLQQGHTQPQYPQQPPQKTYSAASTKEPKIAPKPSKPQPPAEVCLRWNSYHSNMQNTFPSLLNNEQFVDVTLACDGRSIKCHKVMLSACSPYLEELLSANPCQHPIIFLKDMKFWQLAALVDFMYRGEVNVTQDKLPSLLSAAEALQIKGLASPVNAPSPGRPAQDTADSMSILQQFQSEIKTEMDDEEYMQDTDDSEPPTPVVRPAKKRKLSDGSNVSGSSYSSQYQGKKVKETRETRVSSAQMQAALPSHYAPPPSAQAHGHRQHAHQPSTSHNGYQNYAMTENHATINGPNDDLSIDEEHAKLILERYSQPDDSKDDDISNGSG